MLYKTGDIWTTKQTSIVIPVNLAGPMGAGLALQAKERYPGSQVVWRAIQRRPGVVLPWWDRDKNHEAPALYLFPTKHHWSKPADLQLIRFGLRVLLEYVNYHEGGVAVPALGCGLGGLKPQQVKPLLDAFATLSEPGVVEIWSPQREDWNLELPRFLRVQDEGVH